MTLIYELMDLKICSCVHSHSEIIVDLSIFPNLFSFTYNCAINFWLKERLRDRKYFMLDLLLIRRSPDKDLVRSLCCLIFLGLSYEFLYNLGGKLM